MTKLQIIVATKADADTVVNRLQELKRAYGGVTVVDLYDLVGLTGTYLDEQRGWTDLSDIKIEEDSGECTITLPEPKAVRRG
jgi:hypothetical protein